MPIFRPLLITLILGATTLHPLMMHADQERTEKLKWKLFEAMEKNNVQRVEELLKRGIDCNAIEVNGHTPLLYACSHKHFEIAEKLIAHGANINSADAYGYTALVAALYNLDFLLVKLLLEHGADTKNLDIIKKFITNAITDNALTIEHKNNALLLFAWLGWEDVVVLLLERGADCTKAKDQDNNTALIVASDKSHEAIVKMLLEHGAPVNNQNKKRKSALSLASEKGHTAIVELLKKHGAIEDKSKEIAGAIVALTALFGILTYLK